MTKRLGFLPLLLTVMLAACSGEDAAPAADATPATPAPAAASAEPAPAADPAPGADAEAAAASADEDAAAASAEATTETARPAPQPPEGPAPQPGTDYAEIPNGQPYQPLDGKIEVVEVFGYTCPACAQFEPQMAAWKRRQPADVRVTPVAAPFGGYWMPYARAYYAAESMGLVDQTHQAVFEAIHLQRTLPVQNATPQAIGEFYAGYGADAGQFASTMESFAVAGKLKRAEAFINRAGVDSTPTMVVNGKYRVLGPKPFDEVLRIVDHLVARERAAMQP
ncbi:thiol:disulfide interchange protein DsbA/DsbL [Luteimonas sp. RD2P54]|uniref:Thiol:disulfide interchange protein DsbA/DsbL n=1 Tax=Luteimonas endophytica TaxID=3042023 RepID=A0ABT6JCQ3_9GAMM|nr:thiol:disulfide interchange protein DsbA/DsbL [Luteimonas endophytica]MDH5824605.1 thiol:disulfide interchange protein DsbA/DsbL [Luteimonas endophytica]